MGRTAMLLVVMLGGLRDRCGTETEAIGPGGPCTRSSDCGKHLVCVDGMCASPDAGPDDGGRSRDGDASDAGVLDGSTGD